MTELVVPRSMPTARAMSDLRSGQPDRVAGEGRERVVGSIAHLGATGSAKLSRPRRGAPAQRMPLAAGGTGRRARRGPPPPRHGNQLLSAAAPPPPEVPGVRAPDTNGLANRLRLRNGSPNGSNRMTVTATSLRGSQGD